MAAQRMVVRCGWRVSPKWQLRNLRCAFKKDEDWNNGLAVKNICCSSRGSRFITQHRHNSHIHSCPVPGYLMPSSVLLRHEVQHAAKRHICRRNSHTHKIDEIKLEQQAFASESKQEKGIVDYWWKAQTQGTLGVFWGTAQIFKEGKQCSQICTSEWCLWSSNITSKI